MNLKTFDSLLLTDPLRFMKTLEKKEINYRLTKAFTFLEEMIVQNKIKSYGVTIQKDDSDAFPEILEIAREVGGANHGFKYLQTEYSEFSMSPLFDRRYRKDRLKFVKSYYYPPMQK